uniref:Astacin domain-containing protein n=1 Tax=Parastrongyloides trichosuri TaxID=131310 RepID=A0A0N4Z3G2_PARTI
MKIFIVGFFILSFGEISKIVSGDYDMTIELRDGGNYYHRDVRYDFNFDSLDNYNISFTEHLNVKFNNPVKYFIMDYNDLENQGKDNTTYGMRYRTHSSEYNLIGQWAYHRGYTYSDLQIASYLNIHQCDSGLIIADKTYTYVMLNDKSKTYYVDYGIVLLLKAENNRIIFNTFFYKGMNFKATACPYTNW